MVVTNREQELQKLLAEERLRSEQRKTNYSTLKGEHLKLQKDFLGLQSEMKQILEETKFIKEKKNSEVDVIMKKVEERDKIIEKLQTELRQRDPLVIKESVAEELQEPMKKLQKEKESLVRDKEKLGFELKIAKQKIEYLEKENLDGVERVKLAYEAEINLIRKEKEELRLKLMEANQTPDAQKLLNLNQENAKLQAKVKNFQELIEDAEQQYRKIEKKIELLLMEQERNEKQQESDLQMCNDQISDLKEEIRKLRELNNVWQQEKDKLTNEKKLLVSENNRLKKTNEEMEKIFESDKEKLKLLILKEQKQKELERDMLAEDMKKLRLENENKEESIKRLEQENVNKIREMQLEIAMNNQKELEKRLVLEQEKTSLEAKLKEAKEERVKMKDEIEQLKRQSENSYELRIGVERDLLILRAKLESYQSNIEELDKLRRQHLSLHDELNKLRSENSEYLALNRELIRQKERYKDDYNQVKSELDEERKQLNAFKIQSERHLAKLKSCIEEERSEMREKLSCLERDALRWRNERDEVKSKCKSYAAIAEQLQNKLTDANQAHDSKGSKSFVSSEVHRQLKKQFKTLKKQHGELSSLLNCTFDSSACKQLEEQPKNSNYQLSGQ